MLVGRPIEPRTPFRSEREKKPSSGSKAPTKPKKDRTVELGRVPGPPAVGREELTRAGIAALRLGRAERRSGLQSTRLGRSTMCIR